MEIFSHLLSFREQNMFPGVFDHEKSIGVGANSWILQLIAFSFYAFFEQGGEFSSSFHRCATALFSPKWMRAYVKITKDFENVAKNDANGRAKNERVRQAASFLSLFLFNLFW